MLLEKLLVKKEDFSILRPLMTAGLPLIIPLVKNILLPFGLSAAISAIDAAI